MVFEHDLVRAVVANELSLLDAGPIHAAMARVLAERPDTTSAAAVAQHLLARAALGPVLACSLRTRNVTGRRCSSRRWRTPR